MASVPMDLLHIQLGALIQLDAPTLCMAGSRICLPPNDQAPSASLRLQPICFFEAVDD